MESANGVGGSECERKPLSEVVGDCVQRWFQDAYKEARKGDIANQVLVAQMFFSGYGTPKNEYKKRKKTKLPSEAGSGGGGCVRGASKAVAAASAAQAAADAQRGGVGQRRRRLSVPRTGHAPHRAEDAGRPLLPETGSCTAPHAENAGWPHPAVVRPACAPPCAVEAGRPRLVASCWSYRGRAGAGSLLELPVTEGWPWARRSFLLVLQLEWRPGVF